MSPISPPSNVDFDAVMRDDHILEQAGRRAVRQAFLEHKRAGLPIVVMKDGVLVWISPEEIPVD